MAFAWTALLAARRSWRVAGVLALMASLSLSGCSGFLRGGADPNSESDRTEMRHVFRFGEAEIAAERGQDRVAFAGYLGFLRACAADARSEVCALHREKAEEQIASLLGSIDRPAPGKPFAQGWTMLTRAHDPAWIDPSHPDWFGILAAVWRDIAMNALRDDVLDLSQRALARWIDAPDAPIAVYQLAVQNTLLAGSQGTPVLERAEARREAARMRALLLSWWSDSDAPARSGRARTPQERRVLYDLWADSVRRAAEERHETAERLVLSLPWIGGEKREVALLRIDAELAAAAAHWDELYVREEDENARASLRVQIALEHRRAILVRIDLGLPLPPNDVAFARRAVSGACGQSTPVVAPRACAAAVELARRLLDDQERLFRETDGQQGSEARTSADIEEWQDRSESVRRHVMPRALLDLIEAMDEYVARVPARADHEGHRAEYMLVPAEQYFFHGDVAEATRRLRAMDLEKAGSGALICRAWDLFERVLSLVGGIGERRAASESHVRSGCPVDAPGRFTLPDAYVDAGLAFRAATAETDPAARRALFLRTAGLYEVGLLHAPDIDDAPEAALNGGYAYKQAGQPDQAIRVYELFIAAYGAEPLLTDLRHTSPKRYGEHLHYLLEAHQNLAAAHLLAFDLASAAAAYERVARSFRFSIPDRLEAARNAVRLRALLDDKDASAAARALVTSLEPGKDKPSPNAKPKEEPAPGKGTSAPTPAPGAPPRAPGAPPRGKTLAPPVTGRAPMLPAAPPP